MKDRDFLEIFDRIDDKFLTEAYKDSEKLRRGGKRVLFHALYTAAACIMVVAAAVLIVSSFIGRDKLVQPSSADGQPADSLSDSGISSEPVSSVPELEIPVYDRAYFVESSKLEFFGRAIDAPTKDYLFSEFYADYQQENIPARLSLGVSRTEEYTGGDIPMRMYLFSDGRQMLFTHDNANIPYLDVELDAGGTAEIDFSFYAGRHTVSAAVVCVFFPGDAARQSCFIKSASNAWSEGSFYDYDFYAKEVVEFPVENIGETDTEVFALSNAEEFDAVTTESDIIRALLSADGKALDGEPVRTLSRSSSGVLMYSRRTDGNSLYYLITLINGEPAPVFDGEFFTIADINEYRALLYRLPSEYLSENSTVQMLALPALTTGYNWWGIQSECVLISE